MVYLTAVRIGSTGTKASHITDVMWLNTEDGQANQTSVAQIIEFIERPPMGGVRVAGPNGPTDVKVVRPTTGTPYIRTNEDNSSRDNLLSLPRF